MASETDVALIAASKAYPGAFYSGIIVLLLLGLVFIKAWPSLFNKAVTAVFNDVIDGRVKEALAPVKEEVQDLKQDVQATRNAVSAVGEDVKYIRGFLDAKK